MQPLINRFRDIPESGLVLSIINTVDPRLALEVAYASGKKDVVAAVRARILTFRAGNIKPEKYLSEREFYLSIRKFADPMPRGYLGISEERLAVVSTVNPNLKMLRKIRTAIYTVIDRISDRKFLPLVIIRDTLQQKKTVQIYNNIAKNLETFLDNTLQRYNSSFFRLFSDNIVIYAGTNIDLAACPLRLSKGTNPLVTATVGEYLKVEVSNGNQISHFEIKKKYIHFPVVEKPRTIHYLTMRVFAELFYQRPNPIDDTVDIEYALRPIAYALGIISYNKKAEKKYEKALEEGKLFAKSNRGLEKRSIVIEVNPKDPHTLEKRKEILLEPVLNIIDSDIYKYV